MPIPTYGSILLTPITPNPLPAPITVTTDPDGYGRTWDRRQSVHIGLEGAVTIQDFGRFAKDCTISLTWSPTQPLNVALVQQLKAWDGVRASRYRFEDSEGNDFTVAIRRFQETRIFGQPDLYHGTLELHVLAMSTFLGQPYTGD